MNYKKGSIGMSDAVIVRKLKLLFVGLFGLFFLMIAFAQMFS